MGFWGAEWELRDRHQRGDRVPRVLPRPWQAHGMVGAERGCRVRLLLGTPELLGAQYPHDLLCTSDVAPRLMLGDTEAAWGSWPRYPLKDIF